MKTLLTLCFVLAQLARADWEMMPPLPEPAGGFVAGYLDGRIIIAGGTNWVDGTKRWLDTMSVFDVTTRQWSAGPKLPNELAYAACVGDGRQIFIAGGADGKQGRKEVWSLDATLKLKKVCELTQPVVFGGAVLQDSTCGTSAMVKGGMLCLFGGSPDPDDWSKMTTDFIEVNTMNGKVANGVGLLMDHGLGLPAMISTGDRVLTFTGAWFDAQQQVHNTPAACVLEKKRWSNLAPYPIAARGVSAVLIDSTHVYLAGGYGTDEQGFLTQAFIYDVTNDRYTPATPLPFAATTCLVKTGEHLHVLGGEDVKKHRSALHFRCPISSLLEPRK